MSTVPYMRLYIGDYMGDTAHLNVAQHGAYLLLIMAYWQKAGPLPSDDNHLMMITRSSHDGSNTDWKAIKSDVLAYFEEREGLLYHRRIERELAAIMDISEKRRRAVAIRQLKRANNSNNSPSIDASHDDQMMITRSSHDDQYHSSYSDIRLGEDNIKSVPPASHDDQMMITRSSRFQKPEMNDIRAYCLSRQNNVDPQRFMDHYDSCGWRIGNKPMKDWKAAVRTWERNDFNNGGTKNGTGLKVHQRSTYLDLEERHE